MSEYPDIKAYLTDNIWIFHHSTMPGYNPPVPSKYNVWKNSLKNFQKSYNFLFFPCLPRNFIPVHNKILQTLECGKARLGLCVSWLMEI